MIRLLLLLLLFAPIMAGAQPTRAKQLVADLNKVLAEKPESLQSDQAKAAYEKKFVRATNALDNLQINYEIKEEKAYLLPPDKQAMMDRLNELVSAAGDVDHTPEGMASTGESITMFERKMEQVHAYGVKFYWDEEAKMYKLF